MSKKNSFKIAALAASIALAMASTSALATAPTATQLPGAGSVVVGPAPTAVTTITAGSQTITLAGNTVINWGVASGATLNATSQPGGFNIGSGAALTFAGTGAVLNVDVSGNASQIFGALNSSAGNLFVANTNGIIVGSTAAISAPGYKVGLIANTLGTTTGFTGATTSFGYNGTGGDVTVQTGATIGGATVLVSGGGTVNVDLSTLSGSATLSAGLPKSGGTFAATNANASLVASGTLGGSATLAAFNSAGNASSSGTLSLGGIGGTAASVEGTLTNTGTMNLGAGFAIDGAVVNNKTMTQSGDVSMGSLSNAGTYDGFNSNLTTTAGGLSNSGSMTNMGNVSLTGGDFVNNGQFVSNGNGLDTSGGNVTNNGQVTDLGYVHINQGGNFTNAGTMAVSGSVYVLNGSVTNSGVLSVNNEVETASDSTAGQGFTAGADYSITNTGTIKSPNNLYLSANSDYNSSRIQAAGTTNDSTGSVINGSTGVLQVAAGDGLGLQAYNDVTLGGAVQVYNGTSYKATSAANPLNSLDIYAGDYDGSVNTTGVATVSTAITTNGGAQVNGNQVNLLSNLSSVDATGTPTNSIYIVAGAQQASGYAVRVGSGVTVSADNIYVDGDTASDNPNVLVNGTLNANWIIFGSNNAISNLYTGPSGSLSLFSDPGFTPYLQLNFTGIVKTVPYNNAPNNFRFNGLSVDVTDGSPLTVELNPVAYTTNGTTNGLSAVNLLVNSDVVLQSDLTASVAANGSAVTGIDTTPNTHLVVQSSGSITTQGNGISDFYWPGYVYLGTVAANADGSAAPGTLGLGTITTYGEFDNVLPGNVAGASGIHFITQFPLTLGGDVITNANAWVNFGTDLLTQAYASGTLGNGLFFGGTAGAGTVINYGALDASSFATQAPSATP